MAPKQAEEFIRGRVDTKKLGDVVAIRPEFFKDRVQKHINVDLLKEQIEIYNLGLPMAPKQAEEFIRGRVGTKKTWRRGGHSTRVFQRQIARAHQCRSLKGTNRDLQSRFAYGPKTGRRIYSGESEHQKNWRRGGHSTRVFKDRLQEHINVDLLKEIIEIYNLGLPIASKQAEEFIIIYYYFLSIPLWPLFI